MTNERILVVEDDADIQELLRYNLETAGYRIEIVERGEDGLRAIRKQAPDLVVLDLMLPGLDGLDVCKQIKGSAETERIPVLMISARGEESDVVIGLELGADDYVAKPFSPRLLLARIKAILRRRTVEEPEAGSMLVRGELRIDPGRHRVLAAGKELPLTPTEFGILQVLARKPGWVFTRQQIVDAVRGADYAVTERAVDVQIVGLRKKLGAFASLIETVRGIGYRFSEQSGDKGEGG